MQTLRASLCFVVVMYERILHDDGYLHNHGIPGDVGHCVIYSIFQELYTPIALR